MKPPLKWVGGKTWLLPRLSELYRGHRSRRLVEPFVGGMSVSLGLEPFDALLCDKNPHLVNFYWRLLDPRPFEIEMRYDEALYYAYRDAFNAFVGTLSAQTATAGELFYYLNRTCFNGVCRFNRSGKFNVPFGKYSDVQYRRDFSEYAPLLQRWHIECRAFDDVVLEPEDFVYADPPYDGTFDDYSSGGFSWDDQQRLAHKLAAHTGPVVASNSSTERVLALYRSLGFAVSTVEAPRRVSSDGDRTPALEMLATKNFV